MTQKRWLVVVLVGAVVGLMVLGGYWGYRYISLSGRMNLVGNKHESFGEAAQVQTLLQGKSGGMDVTDAEAYSHFLVGGYLAGYRLNQVADGKKSLIIYITSGGRVYAVKTDLVYLEGKHGAFTTEAFIPTEDKDTKPQWLTRLEKTVQEKQEVTLYVYAPHAESVCQEGIVLKLIQNRCLETIKTDKQGQDIQAEMTAVSREDVTQNVGDSLKTMKIIDGYTAILGIPQ